MKRQNIWWSLAALLITALLAPSSHADDARVKKARALFEEGAAASRAEAWPEAVKKFRASMALKRHAMTLYSLGVAQRESGDELGALRSFRAFLAEPTSAAQASFRVAARDAVDALVGEVGRVVVTTKPADAHVVVDGEVCVTAIAPCLVAPGQHRVQATAVGYDDTSRIVNVRAGGTTMVALHLESAHPPTIPIVLTAIGGGSAVAGTVLTIIGTRNQAEERGTALPLIAAGNVALAAGLVAVTAGATWIALEPSPEGVTVEPMVGLGSLGVRLRF